MITNQWFIEDKNVRTPFIQLPTLVSDPNKAFDSLKQSHLGAF